MISQVIRARLRALANPKKAEILQRFFKTGPCEYAEGDRFLGIQVPELRKLAKEYALVPLPEIGKLLTSPIHEERFLALLLMMNQHAKGNDVEKTTVYDFYVQNVRFINNWDLVDISAPYLVGAHLWERDKRPLSIFATSANVWERRIAILATFFFIKRGSYAEALRIAGLLLQDKEDLIHKAVGWMLREIGKRSLVTEEEFLRMYYKKMPRTMLRYAIERFPEPQRQQYLQGVV